MKTRLLFGIIAMGFLMSSCYTETIITDGFVEEPVLNTDAVLQSYDLWYVNINETRGNGEVPFLQMAFTISFVNGVVYANNNIVGIGKTGDGFGLDVGIYNPLRGAVEVDHDVDGLWLLEVFAINRNTLEFYDPRSDTSYILIGYQRNTFDYDMVFYDNINYFIQE
ncbi:MAG: nicotinic acid mononucleotide adenyltransferase, partial [Bacteroidota bacterium]